MQTIDETRVTVKRVVERRGFSVRSRRLWRFSSSLSSNSWNALYHDELVYTTPTR